MKRIDPAPRIGCLLGTAVGQAIGLPFEERTRRRVPRWIREPLGTRVSWGDLFVACIVLLHGRDRSIQRRSRK